MKSNERIIEEEVTHSHLVTQPWGVEVRVRQVSGHYNNNCARFI